MSSKTIFLVVICMVFVAVMTIGMTLLFKDRTEQALQVFGVGGMAAFFVLWMGMPAIEE